MYVFGSLTCRFLASTLVFWSTVSPIGTFANAQELARSTYKAGGLARGWWSIERADLASRPQLSMAELTRFEASASLRRATNPTDNQVDPALLKRAALLALLQTKYEVWESNLSDSRSLTDVNRISVYPLMEINYTGWHLPVALYISPLAVAMPGGDQRCYDL